MECGGWTPLWIFWLFGVRRLDTALDELEPNPKHPKRCRATALQKKAAAVQLRRQDRQQGDIMDKNAQIRELIDDLLGRRADGEPISDDEILSAHPDLRPELDHELVKWEHIRQARAEARE